MTTLAQINETLKLQLELMAQQREDIVKSNEDVVDLKDKISQSLQFQNQLVSQQDKSLKRVSDSIVGLKERIAESIKQQRSDRLDVIEEKREAKRTKERDETAPRGFMSGLGQGTGYSWLSGFLASMAGAIFGSAGGLTGLLTGALGLVAGKVIKWGAIAGIISLFFGDELLAFAEKINEWTGVDLAQLIGENPLLAAALTVAAGMIVEWIAKSILRGLGRALTGAVIGAPKTQAPKTQAPKTTQPRDARGRYTKAPSATRGAPKLPGVTTGLGRGILGGLAKGAARFIPFVGTALLANDVYNLYSWMSEPVGADMTPEELEERRKQSGLAPGEIPTNENRSAAPNRLKAREEQDRLRAEAAKKAAIVDVLKGANPYINMAPNIIDPATLQGRINAFQAYGVDRDRQRMSATERGISRTPPTTASNLTQAAANARISAIINNAPVINNITNNNGGGGNTSVMTVPVGTADVSDRRDVIRRYGR